MKKISWYLAKFVAYILRQGFEIASLFTALPFSEAVTWEDYFIGKNAIKTRIYTKNPHFPCLIYAHGGGWVSGSLKIYHSYYAHLAEKLEMTVIAVDYRLAPEHPYPAAQEDLYDVYQWVRSHSFYKKQPFFFGGDSAGGNLVTSLMIRLSKDPSLMLPKALILICPSLDLTLQSLKAPYVPPSNTPFWVKLLVQLMVLIGKSFMAFFRYAYIPKKQDIKNPLISPFYQEDFSRFPQVFMVTATADVLYKENCAFTHKLNAKGGIVFQYIAKDMPHIFVFFRQFFYHTEHTMDWLQQQLKNIV